MNNSEVKTIESGMENIKIEKKKYVRPKCIHGKRKSVCVDCGGGYICPHLKEKSKCRECSPHNYCEHNRRKSECIPCHGSNICIHSKLKHRCKECHGTSLCIHLKRKDSCKECNIYGLYCEHNKKKIYCTICDGSGYCEHGIGKYGCSQCSTRKLCEHGKTKNVCKVCSGVSICKHGRRKTHCRSCGGSVFCEHDIQKTTCKICNKNAYCVHNVIKSQCIKCDSDSICEHKKRKTKCKICLGGSYCEHGKLKAYCNEHGGQALCKSTWCETTKRKKYNGYCLSCCVNLFPDIPVYRNYKTKENDVVTRVKEVFPDFSWIADKIIKDGCSKRRPDLLLDMATHVIIIEVDENKHSNYESSCENKRLMELSQDLGHRPIVFIRFNPDAYTNADGVKITSCWRLNKLGVMSIMQTKQKEWTERILKLTDTIDYWIKNVNEKTIEIIELYY